MISANKAFILDASEAAPRGTEELQNLLGLINMMIVPIYAKDNVIGMLGIGNNKKGFKYPHGDEELLAVFAKQMAIAIESESLTRDVARLQIKDGLTGLFNVSFIRNRLDEEIKRAIRFQRPCAFILLEVNNFKEYLDTAGIIASETALKRIATVLLDSISDIDRAARFKDDQFALILPEKNKRQCLEKAEEIRKKIEFLFSEEREGVNRLSVTGAVTENPIDGITANELTGKAEELLKKAKTQAVKNTIIS